jgi:hypothetical protein
VSFKSPSVVVDHSRRDFILRFSNRPVHNLTALFSVSDGN